MASGFGFAAGDLTYQNQTREAFANQTTAEVAQAAFGAEQGAVAGPIATEGTFHVVRVESVERTQGRPLEAVQAEIAAQLRERKLADALNANETTFAGNETMLTALTQLNELYDMGCMGENALADANADSVAKMANGEVAMAVQNTAFASQVAADFPEAKKDQYDLATIANWLENFIRRFFEFSQFKRSAMPNGPKVSSGGALSPRGDWRAPSDAVADVWLAELRDNVPG